MEPPTISEPWYLIQQNDPFQKVNSYSIDSIDNLKLDTRIMDVLYDFGKDLWINIRSSDPRTESNDAFGYYPNDIYFHVRRTGSNDFIRAFEIISVWVRTAPWIPMKNESGWKVIHYDKNNPWNPKSIPEDQKVAVGGGLERWEEDTSESSMIWKDTGLLKGDGKTSRNIWLPLSWLDISSFIYRESIRIEGVKAPGMRAPSKVIDIRVLPYLWNEVSFRAAINKRSI